MWLAGWVVVVIAVTSYPRGIEAACNANEALSVIDQLENDTITLENWGAEGGRCSAQRLQEFQRSVTAIVDQCSDPVIRERLRERFEANAESLDVQCEVRERCECCGQCDVFEPQPPQLCGETTITLTEGGPDGKLQFKLLRSPNDICGGRTECQVILEFVTSSREQQSSGPMEQIVFRDGCSMEIQGPDWGRTRSVHFAAKIDRVRDGLQKRWITVVMKTVVNGGITERNLCEYEVEVHDRDIGRGSTDGCSSRNDPHLTTFDGTYYDVFIEGEFILYKHDHLPYQVNTMYQKCNTVATCNCGVAVKSGDTVFVTERCRRRGQNCQPGLPFCGGNRLNTVIYSRGIASNMRVFGRDAGTGFDVLLPHGTLVKITASRVDYINVVVYPSAADWENTKGLCGFYDNINNNDLRKPDGSTYPWIGTRRSQQPNAFSTQWRVRVDQTLFNGVPDDPYSPAHYCDCPSTGTTRNRMCNRNALVDTSNINKDGEISLQDISVDLNQLRGTQAVGKRDVTDLESFTDSLDLDPNDEPSEEDLELDSSWSEENATLFCDDAIKTQQDWARKCLTVPGVDPHLIIQNCISDIMISGSTVWVDTALEAIKLQCVNTIEVNNDFRQNEGRQLEQEIRDQLCPQDCNSHGRCQNGSCICNDGYVGADCHYREDTRPEDLSLPDGGLCNTRASDCSVISVFGEKFIASSNLTCHLQAVQVTESGVVVTEESSGTVMATYLSINQILCRAPLESSYLVDVSNDGVTSSGRRILYIAHDPYCYDCDVGDAGDGRCTQTTSGCVVDGRCYKADEDSPHSVCHACNPGRSLNKFTRKASDDCQKIPMEVIIAVCILAAVVIVVVIIGYCCWRRQKIQSLDVTVEKPSE